MKRLPVLIGLCCTVMFAPAVFAVSSENKIASVGKSRPIASVKNGVAIARYKASSTYRNRTHRTSSDTMTRQLRTPLSHVRFNRIPLNVALRYISKKTQVPIFVDWKRLELLEIERDTPISLTLKNVPAHVVLSLVLRQASPYETPGMTVKRNYLHITTKAEENRHRIIRLYNVRRIKHRIPDFTDAPSLRLNRLNDNSIFSDD